VVGECGLVNVGPTAARGAPRSGRADVYQAALTLLQQETHIPQSKVRLLTCDRMGSERGQRNTGVGDSHDG